MKSILKILLYLTAGFLVLILISGISMYSYYGIQSSLNTSKTIEEAPARRVDDHVFRDLNKNSKPDV
jgi:hypothetical protein